jgi:hypothetical protein
MSCDFWGAGTCFPGNDETSSILIPGIHDKLVGHGALVVHVSCLLSRPSNVPSLCSFRSAHLYIHLFIHRFTHKRTPPPNRLPLQHQHDRRKAQRQRYESQQTTRPLEAQIRIHRHRRQWQKGRKDILTETHGGTRTGCVLGVGVGDVHHDGLHDDHGAETDKAEADGGQDPGEEAVAGPAVPEKTAGEAEEAAWNAEIETDFRKAGVGLSRVRCSGAREYFVLDEASEESGEFADHD